MIGMHYMVKCISIPGTDNAISKFMDFGQEKLLNLMKPASPLDAAIAIVRGGAINTREVFFPYLEMKILTSFRDWIPEVIDSIGRYMQMPAHYNK